MSRKLSDQSTQLMGFLFYFVFEGNFQVQASPPGGGGGLYPGGDLTEGFLRYEFGGLYLEGLIFGILRYALLQSSLS